MLKQYQKKIIELMIRQELLLAKLYTLFAEQFTEQSEIWDDLANEEKKHASWLKKLYDAGEKGLILFDEGKIKTYTMNSYIDHLMGILVRAENQELTQNQAITFALDLEHSLIEKNAFARFDSTSEKARSILKKLTTETEKHIKKVQALRA
jgi:rubrerythrin